MIIIAGDKNPHILLSACHICCHNTNTIYFLICKNKEAESKCSIKINQEPIEQVEYTNNR